MTTAGVAAGKEEVRRLFSPAESWGKTFTSQYGTARAEPGCRDGAEWDGTEWDGTAAALGLFAKAASGELLKEGSANECGEKSRKVPEVEKVTHMTQCDSPRFVVPLRQGAESPSAPLQR